jgi:formate hydrogenlyase subunit 6/NADH:ubiquinone oxidoreductase subunit I
VGRLFAIAAPPIPRLLEPLSSKTVDAPRDQGLDKEESTLFRWRSIFGVFPQLWRTVFSRPITVRYPFGELELPPYFRGRVVVDASRCAGCGLCARDCPAYGLVLEGTPQGGFRLLHYPDRCANCGQCEINCRTGAIRLTNAYVPATFDRAELVEVLVERVAPSQPSPVGPTADVRIGLGRRAGEGAASFPPASGAGADGERKVC